MFAKFIKMNQPEGQEADVAEDLPLVQELMAQGPDGYQLEKQAIQEAHLKHWIPRDVFDELRKLEGE